MKRRYESYTFFFFFNLFLSALSSERMYVCVCVYVRIRHAYFRCARRINARSRMKESQVVQIKNEIRSFSCCSFVLGFGSNENLERKQQFYYSLIQWHSVCVCVCFYHFLLFNFHHFLHFFFLYRRTCGEHVKIIFISIFMVRFDSPSNFLC